MAVNDMQIIISHIHAKQYACLLPWNKAMDIPQGSWTKLWYYPRTQNC